MPRALGSGMEQGVREAATDELAPLSLTLADAFVTDPILRWLIPARIGRGARLRRLFAGELEQYVFPSGRALTTDGYRGASLELPPGRWQMPTSMPLRSAIGLLRVYGMRLPQAARAQAFFEHHHLQEPHYYVRYVGVAARHQGEGVGTALLRATLERCDREQLPAYLEASSERSAQLYARLGFVHLGSLRFPEGPQFWPMRRPPTRS